MSYRIIFLDIDGTLVNDHNQITKRTKDILIKAQEKGIRLCLASGRPLSGLEWLARELKMDQYHGLLILYNGAIVMDFATGEKIYENCIPVEECDMVFKQLKSFDVRPIIDDGNFMYVNDVFNGVIHTKARTFNVLEFESRKNRFQIHEVFDMEGHFKEPLTKIVIAGDEDYLLDHVEEIIEPVKDRLTTVFSTPFFFEFMAKGVSKGETIEAISNILSIPKEDMIAFGDAQNDISMLEHVGTGVAMGNAPDEVKKIADAVTDTNNADGIAKFLEKRI